MLHEVIASTNVTHPQSEVNKCLPLQLIRDWGGVVQGLGSCSSGEHSLSMSVILTPAEDGERTTAGSDVLSARLSSLVPSTMLLSMVVRLTLFTRLSRVNVRASGPTLT